MTDQSTISTDTNLRILEIKGILEDLIEIPRDDTIPKSRDAELFKALDSLDDLAVALGL